MSVCKIIWLAQGLIFYVIQDMNFFIILLNSVIYFNEKCYSVWKYIGDKEPI